MSATSNPNDNTHTYTLFYQFKTRHLKQTEIVLAYTFAITPQNVVLISQRHNLTRLVISDFKLNLSFYLVIVKKCSRDRC